MSTQEQWITDSKNHYEILQVPRSATRNEIKASFHRLALAYHPDRNSSSTAAETYRRIQLAWECLGDCDDNNDLRKVYDRELQRKEYQIQAKTDSSIVVKFSEMEEAVEEDTNQVVFVYRCRCGDEVILDGHEIQNDNPLLIECQGCSIVYSVQR
jgi:DnaJ-class molecular chaperone